MTAQRFQKLGSRLLGGRQLIAKLDIPPHDVGESGVEWLYAVRGLGGEWNCFQLAQGPLACRQNQIPTAAPSPDCPAAQKQKQDREHGACPGHRYSPRRSRRKFFGGREIAELADIGPVDLRAYLRGNRLEKQSLPSGLYPGFERKRNGARPRESSPGFRGDTRKLIDHNTRLATPGILFRSTVLPNLPVPRCRKGFGGLHLQGGVSFYAHCQVKRIREADLHPAALALVRIQANSGVTFPLLVLGSPRRHGPGSAI